MNSENLYKLTEEYVKYFNNKNIEKTMQMFSEDSYLQDPDSTFKGISNIRKEITDIYSFEHLELNIKNIYANNEDNFSILEFHIIIGSAEIEGVDVIKWKNNKITSMHAYVNELKERTIHNTWSWILWEHKWS